MKILVTGASGFVGTHVCDYLAGEGHEVWGLVRDEKKFTGNRQNVQLLVGDLEHLPELPDSLDAVVHTAGLVHSFQHKNFYRVNTEGTRLLCEKLRPKTEGRLFRFILISSLAAAGPSLRDQPITEENPASPVGHYGKSKLLAEKILEAWAPDHWMSTIIRPPIVIGPRDTAMLDVFKMVKKGFFLCAGRKGGEKQYSFICVHDLVELIGKALKVKAGAELGMRIYFSSYPGLVSYRELVLSIGRAINEKRPPKKLTVPLPLLTFISHLLARLSHFFPVTARLSPDKMLEIREDFFTCSPLKSTEELGMDYRWNLERTIQCTLDDYRKRRWS